MAYKAIELYSSVEGWPKFQLIQMNTTLLKIKIKIYMVFPESDYYKTFWIFCLSSREGDTSFSTHHTQNFVWVKLWFRCSLAEEFCSIFFNQRKSVIKSVPTIFSFASKKIFKYQIFIWYRFYPSSTTVTIWNWCRKTQHAE